MKKSYVVLCSAFLLLLSVSGCSWQIPEKISVKTKAEYNFNFGTIKKDFKDVFDIGSMLSNLDVKNARIYDYFPNKKNEKLQQYLIKIPLFEIPVDFGQYFNGSEIANQIEDMSFEQDVTVPTISIEKKSYLKADFISTAIATALTFAGQTGESPEFALDFSFVNITSGTLTITCLGISDGSSVTITSDSKSFTGYFKNGSAEIKLSSFILKKNDVKFSFTGMPDLPYYGIFSDDTVVKQAEGLNSSTPIPASVDTSVDLSSDSAFDCCEVASGSLTTNLKIPSSWSGISMTYGLTVTGGMNFVIPNSFESEKTVDLSGKKVSSEETTFTAAVNLAFNNAVYKSSSLEFEVNSNITKFKKISLILDDEITTSVSKSEEMSDAMLDTVKSLTIESSGLKATYTNTFPTGNNITIKVKSDFLGLDKSGVLNSETESNNLDILTDTLKVIKFSKNPSADDEYNSWDFDVDVFFPGATTEKPNNFEICDVESGATYKVGIKLTPEINWKEIVIIGDNFSTSATTSLGINLGSIFDSFKDSFGGDFINNVRIPSLPMYVYCNKPTMSSSTSDPFADAKFKTSVSIFGGVQNDDGTITKVTDADGKVNEVSIFDNEDISFQNVPELEIEDKAVITDISKCDYSAYSEKISEITKSENFSDSELYLDYSVAFSNSESGDIKITPDMIDPASSTSTDLGITAIIILPLQFTVANDDINLDLMNLVGLSSDSDILGRSKSSSLDSISEYISAVKSASLDYVIDKSLFYSEPDISINVKFANTDIDENYDLKNGSITLDSSAVNQIFETYPLVPEVYLNIKKDSVFSVSRYTAISLGISLQLKTDGTIVLYDGGKK